MSEPPPLPTPPPLPAQTAPRKPSTAKTSMIPSGPRRTEPRKSWVPNAKKSIWDRKWFAGGVGFAVIFGFFALLGWIFPGDRTELVAIRYVSAETDDAGRIVETKFEADFQVVASGEETKFCHFQFYDRDDVEIQTPGNLATSFKGAGTEKVRVKQDDGSYQTEIRKKSKKYRAQQTLTVPGVPYRVRMTC